MKPLIATTKGNIPIEGLRYETEWKVSPENVIFSERYYLGDELVKESSHICVLSGAASIGDAGIV